MAFMTFQRLLVGVLVTSIGLSSVSTLRADDKANAALAEPLHGTFWLAPHTPGGADFI